MSYYQGKKVDHKIDGCGIGGFLREGEMGDSGRRPCRRCAKVAKVETETPKVEVDGFAAQKVIAIEITRMVERVADDKIFEEINRVLNLTVPLAKLIAAGWVTAIDPECADDLTETLESIKTIIEHGTWEKPGKDVSFSVSTNKHGELTADSILKCSSNTFETKMITDPTDGDSGRSYVGRPAHVCRVAIAVKLRDLGFKPLAFDKPAEEVMRWVDNPYFTGYVFAARHIEKTEPDRKTVDVDATPEWGM